MNNFPEGLVPCFFVDVHCQECGELRVALEHPPTRRRTYCPGCYVLCQYDYLGKGATRRPLPFWDKLSADVFIYGKGGVENLKR